MFVPRLRHGGCIALLAPSSPLRREQPVEDVARAVEAAMGCRTVIMESCRGETACGYAAAPAEVKARDINTAFADPAVDAIWCLRGGSTALAVLPLLDEAVIRANPKPFIGFSDVTALHLALGQRCALATFHGPNANSCLQWSGESFSRRSLLAALCLQERLLVENPPGEKIRPLRPGIAEGRLTGGNLSLVAASLGTPWQIDARGRILYLEDVGERVDQLEKMLLQLRYAGVLEQAAALVFGVFTGCRNDYRPDYGPEALLQEMLAGWRKPAICHVFSAHCTPMVTLPLGARCRVDGDRGELWLLGGQRGKRKGCERK